MLRADFEPDTGQAPDPAHSNNYFASGQPGDQGIHQHQFGMPLVNNSLATPHPGATGQRYYTIQRVNGNGGNGKGDGVPGPHKHPLSESDRVKKNTVQRFLMKRDKEEKKTQVGRQTLHTLNEHLPHPGTKLYFRLVSILESSESALFEESRFVIPAVVLERLLTS